MIYHDSEGKSHEVSLVQVRNDQILHFHVVQSNPNILASQDSQILYGVLSQIYIFFSHKLF